MYRLYLIDFIREHQYYRDGALEQMSENELKEIYENLIDWIG